MCTSVPRGCIPGEPQGTRQSANQRPACRGQATILGLANLPKGAHTHDWASFSMKGCKGRRRPSGEGRRGPQRQAWGPFPTPPWILWQEAPGLFPAWPGVEMKQPRMWRVAAAGSCAGPSESPWSTGGASEPNACVPSCPARQPNGELIRQLSFHAYS